MGLFCTTSFDTNLSGMDALERARDRGVYFFVNDDEANLHLSIVLVQALAELGVPVFANTNAVTRGDGFIFKKSNV